MTWNDRRYARDQQVRADQQADRGGRQLQSPADDQWHRDRPRVHDEKVLQAEHRQPVRGEDLIHRMHLDWLI